MHCLSALFSEHPSSVTRLTELINVSPSRASKILKHLEERELITRSMDSSDHRRGQVILTAAGVAVVEKILAHFAEIGSELLGNWRRELTEDFSWMLEAVTHPK
jgi:DNA-binding MarR family transcriptional regulator